MKTQWHDIPGYEGLYQINSQGTIRSLERVVRSGRGSGIRFVPNRVLSNFTDGRGYVKVQLFKEGKKRTFSVKKLMSSVGLV